MGSFGFFIVCFIAVMVKAQMSSSMEVVNCYGGIGCMVNFVVATISDCCDNSVSPEGGSYQRNNIEGCNECPIGKFLT